ncbi:hypothetical protein KAJ27_17760 [bacterium]|nr:hypothetical protein [bacterium]
MKVKKIKVTEFTHRIIIGENENNEKIFDIELIINDMEPAELLGLPGKFYFDLYYFLESIKHENERNFIFSCDCGDPGCGGWDEGILLTVNKDNVNWYIDEKIDGAVELIFPLSLYKSFTDNLKNSLKKVLLKDPEIFFDRGCGEKLSSFNI